jgi:hypothetical protein
MVSPGEIIDLGKLFQRTFGGKPYVIGKDGALSNDPGEVYRVTASANDGSINGQQITPKGSLLAEQYKGVEIFLPIKLFVATQFFTYLPYCVIAITGDKTIVRTPLPERIGTVKEQYNIDDYKISVKGFLIGDNQQFPEDLIYNLKQLYEAKTAVTIDNALTNIFLTNKDLDFFEQRRVVITKLDIPEVQGGRKNVRPFTIEMESDTVFTLELA